MPGHWRAPIAPTLAELNAHALAGDAAALRALIARSPQCETLGALIDTYVPEFEVARIFDVWADEWSDVKARALLDTLELPAVEPG